MPRGSKRNPLACSCGSVEWYVRNPVAEVVNVSTGVVSTTNAGEGPFQFEFACGGCQGKPAKQKVAGLQNIYGRGIELGGPWMEDGVPKPEFAETETPTPENTIEEQSAPQTNESEEQTEESTDEVEERDELPSI